MGGMCVISSVGRTFLAGDSFLLCFVAFLVAWRLGALKAHFLLPGPSGALGPWLWEASASCFLVLGLPCPALLCPALPHWIVREILHSIT